MVSAARARPRLIAREPRQTHQAGKGGRGMEDDARRTRAALRLVLAQKALSSQLIDNLNASIHIRALLTDIFLIDETLKIRASHE